MRKIIFFVVFVLTAVGFFAMGKGTFASDKMKSEVKVFNEDTKKLESSFIAFPGENGADVAVGDVDGDGYGEILVGAGKGDGPHVRVFTKKGIVERIDFFPFHKNFRGGLSLALGDTNGDGKEDIIVGQKSGGQSWVRVYEATKERRILAEFMAYDRGFQGGVNVAALDIDGDGNDEIATAPGTSGSSLIKFFDGNGKFLNKEFFPFAKGEKGGANLAGGDIDGDGIEELFVGHGPFGSPYVKVYRVDQPREVIVKSWMAHGENFKGGVKVDGADLDGDGKSEVITGAGYTGDAHVQGWTSDGRRFDLNNVVYPKGFRGSLNISSGDIDSDGNVEIVTVPDKKPGDGRVDYYRYIDVSIAEQRLRAYENMETVKTYLVSTGIAKYPTPTGIFQVRSHIAKTRMTYEYGPDHPDNYDLAGVPHVLPFSGPYTIHGAYWHNNFGRKMSHGCVNEPLPEAAWLYNWARNGDIVVVH